MTAIGSYTDEELAEIRNVMERVRNGEKIGDVAKDLATQLNRSYRGLALTIGREIARQSPRRPHKRRAGGRGTEGVVKRLLALSRELDDLGRRRQELEGSIEARVTEYSDLRAKLLETITPVTVNVTPHIKVQHPEQEHLVDEA